MLTALPGSTGGGIVALPAAVVSAKQVHLSGEPVRIGAAGAKPGHGHKRVTLIREQNVVTGVEVICSCGERIVLRCDYE
jgi:hypothetical protein